VCQSGIENRSKTGEIGPVFSKPAGEFENFKNFEIKNSKKIRADFKIFGQTRIRNFKVTKATKFGKEETEGKPRKKENGRFLIRANPSGLPSPPRPLSAPAPPSPHVATIGLRRFHPRAAGLAYQLGLAVYRYYQAAYRYYRSHPEPYPLEHLS
jgi:hypothetical protein